MLWGAVGPAAQLPAPGLPVALLPPLEESGWGAGPRCPFKVAHLPHGRRDRPAGPWNFTFQSGEVPLPEEEAAEKGAVAPAKEAQAPSRGPTW